MSAEPPVRDALQAFRAQSRPVRAITVAALPFGGVSVPVLRGGHLPPWLRRLGHLTGPVALVVCGGLVWNGLGPGFGAALGAALAQIAPGQWVVAAIWVMVSLHAVGHFDATLHRAAGTGVAPPRARRAGRRAIAVAQAAGFGTITAGLVRWRCLPELSPAVVTRLSMLVSLTFLAAWGVLTGVTFLTLHDPVLLVPAALIGGAVLLRLRRRGRPGAQGWSMRVILAVLGWTLVDTAAATMILAAFLPASNLSPGTLYLAYLVALGAGLISQSPGGLGAFELALVAALPEVGAAPLMAAALGYRMVYHVVPAAVAMLLLVRPGQPPAPPLLQARGATLRRALARAPEPDWGLAHQGAAVLLSRDQATGWLVRRAGGTLCSIARPLGPADPATFAQAASAAGLRPLLYKCDARTAARARAAGWPVLAIARDAIIDIADWRLDRPAMRQLRRKLRAAEAAGLRIVVDPKDLPLARMQALSDEWVHAHGRERGFSMGRFAAPLVRNQRVILAYAGDRLAGFVTFHDAQGHDSASRDGTSDWTLDLMRHGTDVPPGTMQALIVAGLDAARAHGARRVSLAACPCLPPLPGVIRRLLAPVLPDLSGLERFKQGFAPRWQTRYATAPGPLSLVLGLACVTRAIHDPPPLSATDFGFETGPASCDALDQLSPSA